MPGRLSGPKLSFRSEEESVMSISNITAFATVKIGSKIGVGDLSIIDPTDDSDIRCADHAAIDPCSSNCGRTESFFPKVSTSCSDSDCASLCWWNLIKLSWEIGGGKNGSDPSEGWKLDDKGSNEIAYFWSIQGVNPPTSFQNRNATNQR
jgi:hypothetical protein